MKDLYDFNMSIDGELVNNIIRATIFIEIYINGNCYNSANGMNSDSTKFDVIGITQEQMIDLIIEKITNVISK